MSEPPRHDPDATQAMPASGDPDATQAMPGTGAGEPPRRPPPPPPDYADVGGPGGGAGQVIAYALLFIVGLAAGFLLARFTAGDDSDLPSEEFVLFEPANSTFPVEGAAFTRTTYDPETGECDSEAMKRFLRADERRFEAWIDLQGIEEDEFDAFVDQLQTRILEENTPVTNHGCFAEGEGECPFAIQSVLEEGTPVWWDPVSETIVAKCACSNPLKEPKCPPNCRETPLPTPSPSPSPTPTEPPQTTRPPATAPPTTAPPPTTEPPTEPPPTEEPTEPPTEPPPTEEPTQEPIA